MHSVEEAGASFKPPITSRGLEFISQLHEMPIREFWGRTILDLGCGMSNLQSDLDNQGVKARVINLDINALQIKKDMWPEDISQRLVTSDLAALPIASESVDMAIATYSLPHWATSVEQIDNFFAECKRVIRVGGIVSIFPLFTAASVHFNEDEMMEMAPYNQAMDLNIDNGWVRSMTPSRGLTALKIK